MQESSSKKECLQDQKKIKIKFSKHFQSAVLEGGGGQSCLTPHHDFVSSCRKCQFQLLISCNNCIGSNQKTEVLFG